MGGCLSKKAKEDRKTCSLLRSKKEAEGSRDPPPTESPTQIEEEKVKEVLSETPTRFVKGAKVANGLKVELEVSDLGSYSNAADPCSGRSVGVLENPPRDSISATSTSLMSDKARAAAPAVDDDDDEEGETAEMKLKVMLMMKKKKMGSVSSSSVGMPRSQFPTAKTRGPAPPRATVAGKREIRGVDVGCRSGRPSPTPMRSREKGNHTRNHINSSPSSNGNVYNNTKTGDMVLIGERSATRSRMRSVSTAASSLKSRSSELEAAAAATKISVDHQHQQRGRHCRSLSSSTPTNGQQRGRHCRSLSSSTPTNGRFPPQRIPARALNFGARRRGQVGNNPNAGGDGMTMLMEGKEESLENPLVSMECFIFL